MAVHLDLLQRLRSRERERQRQQQRSRAGRDGRKSLSYDALPFYMTPPSSTSLSTQSDQSAAGGSGGSDIALQLSVSGTSNSGTASSSGTDLSIQRRQLGERLYPKVQLIQPVCVYATVLHVSQ